MRAATRERMISIMAGAGLAAIIFLAGLIPVCMRTEETA